MNRPNAMKRKRKNPARRHRRKLRGLNNSELMRLRGEWKDSVHSALDAVAGMALVTILKTLGLSSANVLDLFCQIIPDAMKAYGIERLPFKPSEFIGPKPQSNPVSASMEPETQTDSDG